MRTWILSLLFIVISCLAVESTALGATFRDEFDAISYSGNNGTNTWTGAWLEFGEANGPSAGFLRVVASANCTAGNCMRLGKQGDNDSKWLQREADLSGATTAAFTFDVKTFDIGDGGFVHVQVRNGGGAWTDLVTWDLSAGSLDSCQAFDISAFIATDTQVRFWGTNDDDNPAILSKFEGFIHFDNIEILTDGSNPSCTDVGVTKTDSADPVALSTAFTYNLTVTNNGSFSGTNVTLVDTLPGTVAYQSATPSQGSCVHSGEPLGGTVTCTLGTIASSATATVAINVLSPSTGGVINNSATVSMDQGDSNPGNNTAIEPTTILAPVCPGGVVTTTVDSATGGSLRACIIWANGNVGVDTLNVPAGTYTLALAGTGENAAATGDLDITDGIIINGNAAAATIINANSIDRVFDILGASATFTNLSVRGGSMISAGGGIAVNATGSLTMSTSTVSGNTTTTDGGGIATAGGAVGLTNVTLSGNTANQGGGLNCAGPCTLTNVSVTANTAPTTADGVRQTGTGSITFLNTIVANNLSGLAPECSGSLALLISTSNNLSSDASCDFTSAGDQVNTDPLLGLLLDNGGPTFTHELLVGSPAIDTGTNIGCPATDQRAIARPFNAICDIGAFEADAPPVCPGGVVTTTVDSATGGSLRACIIWANGNVGVDTLNVPAGTYTLALAGAGEEAAATGDLDITDGIIINGNAAAATIVDGGAIDRVFDVLGASATFTNLTIRNGNVTGNGGGIDVDATGSLTMSTSTVSGNTATVDGGGIATAGGAVGLTNVTLSGNTANQGGGLNCAGPCTLTNVSVTANTAPTTADGVRQTGTGSITFLNTIVANNLSGLAPECSGSLALLISTSNNLSSDASCDFTSAGDQVNTDPLLGLLLDNGGPTFTHDLLVGSPAIDTGTNTGCPATDQRATVRPDGLTCDIGAVEGASPLCPGGIVTTTVDSVTGGSLRACIIRANGIVGVDTLDVPAGTYTLTLAGTGENAAATGDLDITDGIIINGNAAAATIVDGNALDRVFHIQGVSATFTNLTVRGGNVTGAGGGIRGNGTSTLTMSTSTVSGNTSTTNGGGVSSSGTVALTNVTLSGNTADRGGGFDCAGGPCTLTNVTITGNTAPTNGDGVRQAGAGTITFLNTIVANNLSGGVAECDGSAANLISTSNNLSSDASCDFTSGADQVNTDPLLGLLLANGGPTFTHALLANSPANDGGTTTGCPATDQRATARPIGSSCDIGAFEAAAQAVCPGAVVTNTGDAVTGGSLRACITWANGNVGADAIAFSIAGAGPHTIRPTSGLPSITDPVTIDGSTEPDFVTTPVIEIDGTFAGTGNTARGFRILGGSGGTTIRAIVINRFGNRGMQITSAGNTIVGNWIGLDIDGVTAAGNATQGIFLTGSGDNNTIGGTVAADRNVIAANTQGIHVRGDNNVISGNYIGTDTTGAVTGVGNTTQGIRINTNGNNNMIGGTTAAAANTIAGNSNDGIDHRSTGTANSFLRNSIHSNGVIGIDLAHDGVATNGAGGVTENDAGDIDPAIGSASNNLLNFPVITAATETAGTLSVDFDLDVIPAGNYRIEFFTNPSGADGSGNGEGEVFQSAVTIAHGGAGVESFNHTFAGTAGDILTVTATLELAGPTYAATSEFGDAFTAVLGTSLEIVKRSFETDGTVIPNLSVVPNFLEFKYLLYINNTGAAVTDVSVRDVLAAVFQYQTGTIQVDNSVVECALATCTAAEELAIFTAVNAAGVLTDVVDLDAGSYTGASLAIDSGNQNVGNPQLDINANAVWAILFSVKMP